jgi:hypothetical protein
MSNLLPELSSAAQDIKGTAAQPDRLVALEHQQLGSK